MSMVGEKLRTAREAQKMTVHQVADVTKARADHIRALEAGDFDVFSAPVYIRGFVRSYAGLLKLDVPQTMAELDEELGRTKNFSEPPPLTDQSRGPIDFLTLQLSKLDLRKSLIALGVLLALAIVLFAAHAWQRNRSSDPLSGLEPGVYQPAENGSGATLPVPQPSRTR